MSYLELLGYLAPEVILSLAALAVLFVDLGVMRGHPVRDRVWMTGAVALFGCAAAFAWTAAIPVEATLFEGVLKVDRLTQWLKLVLIGLTMLTLALSLNAEFTKHVGEYFSLLLLATVGMMLMASSEDILMIFVALELASLSLYTLTAFNKESADSAEAALKYFLFGSLASAVTLFGLSLIYGLTGATSLPRIAAALAGKGLDPALALALVMTVTGFGFKIAAVPFHLWAPDTYQGAPTPAAALIASGSKVASFFLFAKVLMLGFAGVEGSGDWHGFIPGWLPIIAVLSVGSLVLGNLAALAQSSLRRLLAYSAIAHVGYMLVGVLALGYSSHRHEGLAALLYYAATYALTTVGAFGFLAALEPVGRFETLGDLAGLSRRAPVVSLCMLVFMLSLAGIPPLAGFFGKFYVFTAAVGAGGRPLGLLWLVIFAIAMSAVSLYYYLQVLKQIYVVPGPSEAPKLAPPALLVAVLVAIATGVVLLGAFPGLLLRSLLVAIKAAGF